MQAILRCLIQQGLSAVVSRPSLVQAKSPLRSGAHLAQFCTRHTHMPTLRSASPRIPAVSAQQHPVDLIAAERQLLQQQANDGLCRPLGPDKPARRRKKAALKTLQKRALEPDAQTASSDTAAQRVSAKKPKARKALLSTMWTAEDLTPLQAKVEQLYAQLNQLYVNPPCPLDYDTPFQLLVAVILSAQVGQTTNSSWIHCLVQTAALSFWSAIRRAQTRR